MSKFNTRYAQLIQEKVTGSKVEKMAVEMAKEALAEAWTTATKKELALGQKNMKLVDKVQKGMECIYYLATETKCCETGKVMPQKIKIIVQVNEEV